MKRTRKQISNSTNKKSKIENKIHPIQLVFNYIDDSFTFQKISIVCKKQQNILNNHIFWKNLCEYLDFEEPKPKAKKYKTWKSIFVKNIDKLCICKKNIKTKNSNLKIINFKLRILSYYCLNRSNFYKTEIYCNFCQYVKDEIEILYQQSHDFNDCCELCDNEDLIINSVKQLIKKIYDRKKRFEFSDFIKKDFVKVIIRNLYNIINNNFIYIERLGGVVKDWNFETNYSRDLYQ